MLFVKQNTTQNRTKVLKIIPSKSKLKKLKINLKLLCTNYKPLQNECLCVCGAVYAREHQHKILLEIQSIAYNKYLFFSRTKPQKEVKQQNICLN